MAGTTRADPASPRSHHVIAVVFAYCAGICVCRLHGMGFKSSLLYPEAVGIFGGRVGWGDHKLQWGEMEDIDSGHILRQYVRAH